ncbi:MAG: ATP synthase F1 subunit gamma [Candidatus Pacebacteria bacterium]|nr:ATP synthase F1 subunit gamma [Candidatus Paceibacterota bacterium]MCD8508268.1 ATP synthase F1 subunit gamma [Candidatus Paceibacterota bacterium]MCD8527744.1 ATP synthase F1 subunit gamma [Candidatus Paceibacterota bacterium]MCD8563494.1 ATP synthase F1 subunit gamma [Candidatus Paceibacterota bacterium]
MALQAKHIKQKISAVGNIKKITKTMEMVAASKMRRAVEASLASRAYAVSALEILVHLAEEARAENIFTQERTTPGAHLMVIVASNKGLAGGYNINVSKKVTEYCKDNRDVDIHAVCIGKQAEKIARRNNLTVVASFTEFKDFGHLEDAQAIMGLVMDLYERDETYQKIHIAYTQFIKALTYAPKVKPLIPVQAESLYMMITDEASPDTLHAAESRALYLFEPSEEEVLATIVPQLLRAVMYQVLLDAYAAEHSSRMLAMQNATENAGELQKELTISYNKARQAAITQEIAEISAGANALM